MERVDLASISTLFTEDANFSMMSSRGIHESKTVCASEKELINTLYAGLISLINFQSHQL